MESLTELYNSAILPMDEELEKQAAEMYKQAEEEDAAGRIMARGFADELNKLAQPGGAQMPGAAQAPAGGAKLPKPPPMPGGTVKTKPGFDLGGGGKTGPSTGGAVGRTQRAPKVPNIGAAGKGQFGKGKTVTPGGEIK